MHMQGGDVVFVLYCYIYAGIPAYPNINKCVRCACDSAWLDIWLLFSSGLPWGVG